MNENDIIKRLGFENSSELADLLGIDIVFCDKNAYFKLGEKNNRGNANTNVLKRGWKVVLKGKNKSEAIERGKCKTPSKFPKGNVPKGKGRDWYFHRGHILGYTFHKYLKGYKYTPIVGENRSWTIEDINDPERNLTTQFSYANEIQGIIEREIESYLSANKDLTLEVKVVYKGGHDAYPIGTEIFYIELKGDSDKENISGHYFIPNTDVGFEIPDTAEESYQDFYTNGYSERYRQYFADSGRSVRNWQLDNESTVDITCKDGKYISLKGIELSERNRIVEQVKSSFMERYPNSNNPSSVKNGEKWEYGGVHLTFFNSKRYGEYCTIGLQGKDGVLFQEIKELLLESL
ncbi:hypothetical protein FAJ36_06950 [Streptococcus suis]|uniref:DNA/RNA non-specific endonuclease n=1 Tax=Streptococcus suis TaxID=1307 RepID=A0A4T2GZB2_STRSU|nr:hypothetical protein [Streptococcus suis]MBY4635093.1 hypothetical protein [Streptococcus suis]TII05009.1 hypothetical protein FAJ36_06950 [Streptococcus suis]